MTRSAIPVLTLAIVPKTSADAEKLTSALAQMSAEDSPLHVQTGKSDPRVVIGSTDEQHLEVVVDRLKRDFLVEANLDRPQVAYREALTRSGEGDAKYARSTVDGGEYAHVQLCLYPGATGAGYVFENGVGDAIPAKFIRAAEEGIRDRLTAGVVAGFPIEDVRVNFYGGSYHDGASTEAAFRIAGSLAAERAATAAEPILLEPVMRIDAEVPADCAAEILRNLTSRGGWIQSDEDRGGTHVIRASAPLAELFGYRIDFRMRTRGRGTCSIQFQRFMPVKGEDDEDRDSLVSAPRRPAPSPRSSGIALPEPDDQE